MAIEQFGKITYNDINNLNNESITTKNIYASDTSADIGTADNPFDKVYANYYYGRKQINAFNLIFVGNISIGSSVSCDWSKYDFIFVVPKGFYLSVLTVPAAVAGYFIDSTSDYSDTPFVSRSSDGKISLSFVFPTKNTIKYSAYIYTGSQGWDFSVKYTEIFGLRI